MIAGFLQVESPCKRNDDETCTSVKKVVTAAGKAGVLPGVVGCPWPSKYTDAPGPENYDVFIAAYLTQEGERENRKSKRIQPPPPLTGNMGGWVGDKKKVTCNARLSTKGLGGPG